MSAGSKHAGERVDELGIPIRVHYYVVAMFSFVTGLYPLAVSFTHAGSDLANPNVRIMASAAVAVSPFILLAGKLRGYPWDIRFYHLIAATGMFELTFAAQYTGSLRGALVASMIVPALAAGYFLPPRHALPHMIAGTAAVSTVAWYSPEANPGLRAAIWGLVVLGGALLIMTTKRHLAKALDANKELSETDPLTGAANLRRLEARLTDEMARVARGRESFALLELDLDDFKDVNDRYSHTLGDEVLSATADAIRTETTEADLVVRRGGDEFLIVAPAIDGRDWADLSARIGSAIMRSRSQICPGVTPTASVGFAVHVPGEQAADLILRADEALHEVKEAGRKQRVAPPQPILAEASVHRLSAARQSDERVRDPIVAAIGFAWRAAALIMFGGCAVIFAPGVLGVADVPGGQTSYLLMGVAIFVLAPAMWWLSNQNSQHRLIPMLLTLGAIGLISAVAGSHRELTLSVIELYLLMMFLQMYLLPLRLALVNAAVMAGLYGGFLFAMNYPQVLIRLNVTISTAATISVLLAIARRRTVELAAQNESMARTDALTGLPNMRRLRARLDDEVRRCEETGDHFALLMIDLDDFKSVNDMYSHTIGDKVIVAVADAINDTVRAADMPARRGGDEFAVVLIGSGDDEAADAAERISEAIEDERLTITPDITPTSSAGWIVWEPGVDVDELLSSADEALHVVKAESHRTRGAAAAAARAASAA